MLLLGERVNSWLAGRAGIEQFDGRNRFSNMTRTGVIVKFAVTKGHDRTRYEPANMDCR